MAVKKSVMSLSVGNSTKLSVGKFKALLITESSTTYCVLATVNENDLESAATIEVVEISLSKSIFNWTFNVIAELTIECSFKNLIQGLNFSTSQLSGLK